MPDTKISQDRFNFSIIFQKPCDDGKTESGNKADELYTNRIQVTIDINVNINADQKTKMSIKEWLWKNI